MKRSGAEKITSAISDEAGPKTDQKILEKIQKREEESEALRKLLVSLNEPTVKKTKRHK